jgi:phosphatidylethanolamine/phosphatidyl-N-methylethanolamine N-methyltransferase
MPFSTVADHLRFLRTFVNSPGVVGAIAPSGSALAAEIIRQAGVKKARTVVELGGGTGAFTRSIVDHAREDALILSIEINPTFAEILSSRFARVHVVADSAERVGEYLKLAGRTRADCIVSGLPWASFGVKQQLRLLRAITGILTEGGSFATFAYVHASMLPAAQRFRACLYSTFSKVKITPVVWWNLPPAYVYRCVR